MTQVEVARLPRTTYVYIGSLLIHVIAVYACAIHFSPWLVFRCFAWVLPAIGISTVATPTDWYLQHLESVTIGPALAAGYFAGLFTRPLNAESARFAWLVPTLVMIYKLLRFETHSVLIASSAASALRYYFDIQPVMPTRANFLLIAAERHRSLLG